MDAAWLPTAWRPTAVLIETSSAVKDYFKHHTDYERCRREDVTIYAESLRRGTEALSTSPYSPSIWLARSKTLLKLQYPDLACGDAYKTLQLIRSCRDGTSRLTHHVRLEAAKILTDSISPNVHPTELMASFLSSNQISTYLDNLEYDAVVVLAQSLLMAGSLTESINVVRENAGRFPEAPQLMAVRKVAKAALTEEFMSQQATGASEAEIEENNRSGEVMVERYPWASTEASRRSDIIHAINDNLKRASRDQCYVKKSNIRDKVPVHDPAGLEEPVEVLGIFAKTSIPGKRRVLKDPTCMCAADDTKNTCSACGDLLPLNPVQQDCCSMRFCTADCRNRATTFYHSSLCGRDLTMYDCATQSPTVSNITVTENRLLLRALAFAVNFPDLHPLQAPVLNRLTSPQGGHASSETHAFLLAKNVVLPIDMLTLLDIDVYANHSFDTWVILTIEGRLRINSREDWFDSIDGEHYFIAINPLYTFFNHSCRPNVTYEEHKGGSNSTLRMRTNRKVNAGEELFISYLSSEDLHLHVTERQEKLRPWFGHDCQCERCLKELEDENQEHSEYED